MLDVLHLVGEPRVQVLDTIHGSSPKQKRPIVHTCNIGYNFRCFVDFLVLIHGSSTFWLTSAQESVLDHKEPILKLI